MHLTLILSISFENAILAAEPDSAGATRDLAGVKYKYAQKQRWSVSLFCRQMFNTIRARVAQTVSCDGVREKERNALLVESLINAS